MSLPDEKIIFNGIVGIDLIWLNVSQGRKKKAPILHIIDTRTHAQNAIFLKENQLVTFGTHSLSVGQPSILDIREKSRLTMAQYSHPRNGRNGQADRV